MENAIWNKTEKPESPLFPFYLPCACGLLLEKNMQCTVSFLACLWGAADREGGSVRTLLPTLGSHPVSHPITLGGSVNVS